MDAFGIREINSTEATGLQVSPAPHLNVIFDQYAKRGVVKAVQNTAEEQKQHEAETSALAPDAYRLSSMSEAAIIGIYRRGKDTMSASDLLRYFGETRARSIRNVDFSQNTGIDECTGSPIKEGCNAVAVAQPVKGLSSVVASAKKLPKSVCSLVKSSAPAWFDTSKADAGKERTRFPVSAFAAVLAVAMSLMLIVASSVLLTRAESNVSKLQAQISTTSAEVAELRSDFEVQNNLLEIRRIAIEEYGMVEEDYLKTDYLSLSAEDSVEAFEEERDDKVSLSALLSAIGIGRGE